MHNEREVAMKNDISFEQAAEFVRFFKNSGWTAEDLKAASKGDFAKKARLVVLGVADIVVRTLCKLLKTVRIHPASDKMTTDCLVQSDKVRPGHYVCQNASCSLPQRQKGAESSEIAVYRLLQDLPFETVLQDLLKCKRGIEDLEKLIVSRGHIKSLVVIEQLVVRADAKEDVGLDTGIGETPFSYFFVQNEESASGEPLSVMSLFHRHGDWYYSYSSPRRMYDVLKAGSRIFM